MTARMLDLRCPVDRRRMFGRIMVDRTARITSENLIEFACPPCRKREGVKQVLHRFDIAGNLVETVKAD